MIALLPLLILILRYRKFSRLALALRSDQGNRMRRYSKLALFIFIGVTIASFIPYAILRTVEEANRLSLGITIFGIFVAAVFDFSAERIKRRLGIKKDIEKRLLKEAKKIAKDEHHAGDMLHKASESEARGDFKGALAMYNQIIEKYPNTSVEEDARACISAVEKRLNGVNTS